jgi:hypothetical protein
MSKDHDKYDLTANIQEVIHVLDTPAGTGEKNNEPDGDGEEREIIHVYPVAGGGVLFTRTPIEEEPLDTTPIHTKHPKNTPEPAAISALLFSVLIPLSCIIFQLYILFNPPIATLTIIPKSQTLSLTGTLQLGRLLNPITISQSQTVPTTGKGHQDPRQARGSITFYNGQLNSVFIPADTLLTGTSGEQIVTDADANIPAANLPQVGQATVSAHTINTGSNGNIPAFDINQGCCATAIKAVNTTSFSGGQDERNFQTVAKSDIDTTANALKSNLMQSMQGALQGELKNGEALQTNPCTSTTTADHQTGQEATQVKVTQSETCSAVAYNAQLLETRVMQLLIIQAEKKVGAGYSELGDPQVSVTAASAQNKKVVVSFNALGLWVYGLSTQEQQYIKIIVAGKTKEKALQLLSSLPGIERASIQWSDDTKLPKDTRYIHLVIIAGI